MKVEVDSDALELLRGAGLSLLDYSRRSKMNGGDGMGEKEEKATLIAIELADAALATEQQNTDEEVKIKVTIPLLHVKFKVQFHVEVVKMNSKFEEVVGALRFARSVIKSGESWSPECERVIDGALKLNIVDGRVKCPKCGKGHTSVVADDSDKVVDWECDLCGHKFNIPRAAAPKSASLDDLRIGGPRWGCSRCGESNTNEMQYCQRCQNPKGMMIR